MSAGCVWCVIAVETKACDTAVPTASAGDKRMLLLRTVSSVYACKAHEAVMNDAHLHSETTSLLPVLDTSSALGEEKVSNKLLQTPHVLLLTTACQQHHVLPLHLPPHSMPKPL